VQRAPVLILLLQGSDAVGAARGSVNQAEREAAQAQPDAQLLPDAAQASVQMQALASILVVVANDDAPCEQRRVLVESLLSTDAAHGLTRAPPRRMLLLPTVRTLVGTVLASGDTIAYGVAAAAVSAASSQDLEVRVAALHLVHSLLTSEPAMDVLVRCSPGACAVHQQSHRVLRAGRGVLGTLLLFRLFRSTCRRFRGARVRWLRRCCSWASCHR